MMSIDVLRSQATVFQWNAGDLRSRLSDFRQFVCKYNFAVIAISESHVPSDFKLSGYEIFQSSSGALLSRVLLEVRRDLTYLPHDFAPDPANEYVIATIQQFDRVVTVISAYLAPRPTFHRQLDSILLATPRPHMITGDFNAHHHLWGGQRTNVYGKLLVALALDHNLVVINDGSPTFFWGWSVRSCLDTAFATTSFASTSKWFVEVESHGSDYLPPYINMEGFK